MVSLSPFLCGGQDAKPFTDTVSFTWCNIPVRWRPHLAYRWGNEAVDRWTWISGVGVMKDADTASPLHVGQAVSPISEYPHTHTHTHTRSVNNPEQPPFLIKDPFIKGSLMWSLPLIEHICSWPASSVRALMAHMSSKTELARDALIGHGPFSHERACPLPWDCKSPADEAWHMLTHPCIHSLLIEETEL